MSQDPYKQDNKSKLPKFTSRSNGSDDNSQRRGPKFSIYWVYAIIFAIIIGFQFFGPFSAPAPKTTPLQFQEMVKAGYVDKYVIITNRNMVRVHLKKEYVDEVARTNKELANRSAQEAGQLSF
jgi:cell division protease FtsH